MLAYFVATLILPWCCTVLDNPEPRLDSFCYWSLSFQLILNDELREKIGASQEQIRQIKSLRGSEKYRSLFDAEFLKQTTVEAKSFGMPFDYLYAKHDETVKKDLAAILNEKQLKNLRVYALGEKFRNSYSAFLDPEVVEFLALTEADARKIETRAEESKVRFEKRISLMRSDGARTIVNSLNPVAQILFAQYAGNKYLPDVRVEPVVDLEKMPFPNHYVGIAEMGVTPRLSEKQFAQVDEIENEIREIYLGDQKNSNPSESGRIAVAERLAKERLGKVISAEQLSSGFRNRSMGWFEANPSKVFADGSLLRYLGYKGKEADSLIDVVKSESKRLALQTGELNRKIFYELCDSLPKAASERMIVLFATAWDPIEE